MINHILILLSVNKTNADFTSRICVMVPVYLHCQNVHYFADLQQLPRSSLPLADTKNISNQSIVVPYAVLVRWENRVIHH